MTAWTTTAVIAASIHCRTDMVSEESFADQPDLPGVRTSYAQSSRIQYKAIPSPVIPLLLLHSSTIAKRRFSFPYTASAFASAPQDTWTVLQQQEDQVIQPAVGTRLY
jgi:hypothetical protein